MLLIEPFEVKWNLEIIGFDRGKRKVLHQRTHNIVINNGRQFIVESVAAASWSGGSFTRVQENVVRYIGVGIGGSRQNAAEALQSPFADAYPTGYPGSNYQTDVNVTVSRLERPARATPALWLKQVTTPPVFPTATSVTWSALFDSADINVAPHSSVPIAEIGLYSSAADPTLPNGGGAYPGASQSMVAYDTFTTLYKTGFWSLLVNWTWTI